MNLSDLFDLSLRGRSARNALEFQRKDDGSITSSTFGEIESRGNRMAQLFVERGLRPGDRLCVYLPNCSELIDVYLACVKTGVIFVPINIFYKEREITHILLDVEPVALVSNAGDDVPNGVAIWPASGLSQAAAGLPDRRPSVTLDGDSPAAIVFTSGTTGVSKGAVLTHNNFASNAINLLTCWKIRSQDRLLLPLPLFHVHGLGNGLHCWLISGCQMRLLERFDYQTAAATFLDFRPTLFFGVPTIYVRLLEIFPDKAKEIGKFTRLFVSGSAPLPAQILEEFRALFGHIILERYGMTETMMNIGNPYIGERRPGTVGLPFPGVSVRLLDAAGNPVRDGEPGELYVRGPNVFSQYWRRPEATAAAFVDGYFRTGDVAIRSSDGYYTLQGRKSDLIISSGFNVYPREIEEFLLELDEVADAAVVGIPDRLRGEVPVAYIVPRGHFDTAYLESRCRAVLAAFKVPYAFRMVKSLPRNALGKVQKHLLDSGSSAGQR